MAEGPLDGHDVAAGRDETGREEVAQVVQPDPSTPALDSVVRHR